MVLKRRERRSWFRIIAESFWPRGGWGRAAQYVKHRLRRLPDKPHRIARGIFAGVFVSFTPLYGFHFLSAAAVAKVMRGNILASLLATFAGNPLTFPFIAALSLQIGHWILGTEFEEDGHSTLVRKFSDAFGDLWHNLGAIFTDERAHWDGLANFYQEVFLPYLVGGLAPGIIAGLISYYVSLPLITAYQNRRRSTLKRKFEALKAAAVKTPVPMPGPKPADPR